MGELDRVAQRHLQHRYPELDPVSGDAERAECYERIERGPAPTDRVGHPDPRKAAPFDLPGVVDDATERPTAGLVAGAHEGHHAQSHDRLPSESIAVTLSSSRSWRIARATMQHICRGGQQPIAQTARARSTAGARRLSTDRRFPSSAGRYWQNPVPGRPGGRPNARKSLKRRAAAREFPRRANREINRPIREANPPKREAPGNSIRTNRKLSACSSRLAATSSRSSPAGRKRRQGGTTLRPAILGKSLGSIRNCAEYAG